jgi:hypothetical protein
LSWKAEPPPSPYVFGVHRTVRWFCVALVGGLCAAFFVFRCCLRTRPIGVGFGVGFSFHALLVGPKVVVLSYTWALSSHDPSENMVSANCTLLNLSLDTALSVEVDINVQVQNETITWVRTLANLDPWHTENVYDIVVIYNSSLGAPLNVWLTPNWNGVYGY